MLKRIDCILAAILVGAMIIQLPVFAFTGKKNEAYKQAVEANTTKVIETPARSEDFNDDWTFRAWLNAGPNKSTYGGPDSTYYSKNFDDSSWRKLDLPHDWSIEQDFTGEVSVEYGALPTGTGWYRKHFVLPETYGGKRVNIDFDGVFMNSYIYVNGQLAGHYPYGYMAFSFDITEYLVCDGVTENVIAVKVNSPIGGSRWYTGSGIYRDVKLTVTEPVHVAQWGTAIYTPNIETEYQSGLVTVQARTTVENEGMVPASVTVRNTILEYDSGNVFAGASTDTSAPVTLEAGQKQDIEQSIMAESPRLWSVSNPNLYKMKTEIMVNNEVVDTYESRFGFTWSDFDKNDGFSLNGEWMKMQGVCMHHDQGALGAVANAAAIERQMQIMKEMGVNAIRVSHNPATPELLRICDELGLMVVEEAFDGWWTKKSSNDYGAFWRTVCTHPDAEEGIFWGQYDFQQMIRKSRNCPSIIMWSIGNEVFDSGSWATEWVRDAVQKYSKEVDPAGHPCTMGENGFKRNAYSATSVKTQMADLLDVVGLNYSEERYQEYHATHKPNWILYGSETASAVTSRGYYSDPEKDLGAGYINEYQLSSYDNSSVNWGRTATDSLIPDRDNKYIAGQFIWTGFDYIGEPSPFGSKGGEGNSGPKSSYFGIVDTAGFPKDSYYLYQSQWLDVNRDPMVHIFPHWNWEDNALRSKVTYKSGANSGKIPVRIYSNAPSVELFVDGESQGKKSFVQKTTNYGYRYQQQSENSDRLYLEWPLEWDYKVGTKIEAVAYDVQGNIIARDKVVTAGTAAKLDAVPERSVISADGYDLSYITVDVQDKEGNFVPTADNEIYFNISGNGKIVGVDNGNSETWERYKDYSGIWKRSAFSGKALVIVQSTKDAGSFTLTATASGLQSDSVTIYTSEEDLTGDQILGYETAAIVVNSGISPDELTLPVTVDAIKADGSRTPVNVEWDLVTAEQLAHPAELTVKGIVEGGAQTTLTLIIRGPAGARPVSVATTVNIQPAMPTTVDVIWTDGSVEKKAVIWEPISGDKLNNLGTFCINGTIEGYSDLQAVANIRIGTSQEAIISLPKNGGAVADASAGLDVAERVIDNKWDQVDAWNNSNSGSGASKSDWIQLKFNKTYTISKVKLYIWKKAYQVPDSVKIEYLNDEGQWTEVSNLQKDKDFILYDPVNVTFDPIQTEQLRFTFSVSAFLGGLTSIGVSEISVYSDVVTQNKTAHLEELKIDNETIPGFASDVFNYTVTLGYLDPVPQVSAAAKDHATCFVRQSLTAYGSAIIEVISEDGKTSNIYTVQFNRKNPVLSKVILLDPGTVTENEIITLQVAGELEDGIKISNEKASISYTVENKTGQAKIENGKLYVYLAGTVEIIAHMSYQGVSLDSAPMVIDIQKDAAERQIISFEAVLVKTNPGTLPDLPDKVVANYDRGLSNEVSVRWDTIDASQYTAVGRFTINGLVEGTAVRPTATIEVVGPLVAENISLGAVTGYPVRLPDQTTVYFSDGTEEMMNINWSQEPEIGAGDIKIYNGVIICGNKTLPVKASVRSAEAEKSDNYVLMFNGWGKPSGLASFTNDTYVNPNSKDNASYLNDGDISFDTGSSKKIWCNYVASSVDPNKVQRSEDWVSATIAVGGQIVEKVVDTARFGVVDEGSASTKTIRIPKSYYVEYYHGPEYTMEDNGAYIDKGGHMENTEYWPDNPLTKSENWTEVQYIEKPQLPLRTDFQRMLEVTFEPVETSLIRIRMEAQTDCCIGVNELEVYGRTPLLNSIATDIEIQINGKDYINQFSNNILKLPFPKEGEKFPEITATAGNNAAVTVIPATTLDPTTVIVT